MKNGVNLHFPTCVYYAYDVISQEDHQKILDECDKIRNQILFPADHWFCDVLTSYHQKSLGNTGPFRKLITAIKEHITVFCDHLDAYPNKILVDHAWINASGLGQYQEQHTHPNSTISAIYYLKAPQGSAGTIFKNPYQKHTTLPIRKNRDITFQEMRYTAEVGKLILFESFVPHLTEQQKIDAERMTFAANFTVK
jgi:uncharacterized protein (TIGR02466 family)